MACLRLTGAYVALLTYAIAEMIHVLIITDTECFTLVRNNCQQLFGGSTGFSRFDDFSMIVVGGLGSTWGPLIGTGLMMIVVEVSKEMGDARNLVLGLALILFVVLLPKGLSHAGTMLANRFLNR